MPLGEIVFDFFDKMKSLSKGYASFEYDLIGYKTSDLVKVDILLNGDKIDAFSIITHKDSAYEKSRDLTKRLKDAIPRTELWSSCTSYYWWKKLLPVKQLKRLEKM